MAHLNSKINTLARLLGFHVPTAADVALAQGDGISTS